MAGLEGAHADEGYANTGGPKDGPVLTMMSKRLRALRKKFNRILQIEENKVQGKPVNKEQEEVLKTKIAIAALIDEYEKLRQPLLIAVKEEVSEREKELLAASLERPEEETSVADEKDGDLKEGEGVPLKEDAEKEDGSRSADEEAPQDPAELPNGFSSAGEEVQEAEVVEAESHVPTEEHEEANLPSRGVLTDVQIADLLTLLYFSQLFDVRSPGDTPSYVCWTKVHERSSCLSYDFVGDDVTTPLIEGDLDALSIFGSMLTTRPPNVTLSHKVALEKCVDYAKAWLENSENPIGEPNSEMPVSYSGLRERLNRILSSLYFTMTPELTTVSQQTAAAAATAAGQYVTKVLVPDAPAPGNIATEVVDGSVYHQDGSVPAQYYQGGEYIPAVPMVVANGIHVPSPLIAVTNSVPFVPENLGAAVEIPQFGSHEEGNQDSPDTDAIPEQERTNAQSVTIQQAQSQNQGYYGSGPRAGGYQNPRGRMGYAGGRGRGSFPNGRGGRGGRGGYANGGRGERQFYDQGGQGGQGGHGGFYPRNQNYYGGGRAGRGPRGGYNGYNGHSNGPAQSAPSPTPQAVATGSA